MIIEWSPQAQSDYWKNIEYLEQHWSAKEVIYFIEQTDYVISILKTDKVRFAKTNHENVHKVLVVKQIFLFYRVQYGKIELLRFWNNYQDLTKFKLK